MAKAKAKDALVVLVDVFQRVVEAGPEKVRCEVVSLGADEESALLAREFGDALAEYQKGK